MHSLNTFLMTGKNKRVAAQRHACSALGQETDGKADVLRKRLLSYVNGSKEKETRVKDIITNFNENEGFSQDLFTQSDDKEPDASNDDNNEPEASDDDLVEVLEDEISSSSTPARQPNETETTAKSKVNSLTRQIKGWIGKEGIEEKGEKDGNTDLNDAIDIIETSFAALSVKGTESEDQSIAVAEKQTIDKPDIPTEKQTIDKPDIPVLPNATDSTIPPKANPPCCEFTFMTIETKRLIERMIEIVAGKDAQIETLEHYLNVKEGHVLKLEDMNKILVTKLDSVMTAFSKKADEVLTQVKKQSDEALSKLPEKISEEKLAKLTDAVEKLNGLESKVQENPHKKWQTECQNIMLGMAEKMENIEAQMEAQSEAQIGDQSKSPHYPPPPAAISDLVSPERTENTPHTDCPEVIIVRDSNAKHLDPNLIHNEKKVTMETRFTLEEAIKKIPHRENPEKVTDIVFMTGLNDSRKIDTSVDTVLKRQKQACHEYSHRFRAARLHIAAVAPVNPKQKNLNQQLKEYSNSAGISYIDNNGLFDRDSGHLRPGMLEGIHYTNFATKTIAKQLKRSLYSNGTSTRPSHRGTNTSNSNNNNNSGTNRNNCSSGSLPTHQQPNISSSTTPANGLMTAMENFFKKAEQMLRVESQETSA